MKESWSDFEKLTWEKLESIEKDMSKVKTDLASLRTKVATISAVIGASVLGTIDIIKKKLF